MIHRQFPLSALLWAALLACTGSNATAQIRTDASLGQAAQTLQGPAYELPEQLGKRMGCNLFHSFEQFNIGSGESAVFRTSSDGIRNVISRVTGGTASQINGPLALLADKGAPAFYFLNPAGVVFGQGAVVYVPGAFHVSTADGLRFPEGVWLANTAEGASTFSSADPVDFGFLAPGRGPVHIGPGAIVYSASGQPLSVVGGDITVDDAILASSEGGPIRVSAAGALSVLRGGKIISYTTGPARAGDITTETTALSIEGKETGTVTGITSLAVTGITDLIDINRFIDRMDTEEYRTAITEITGLNGHSATGNTGHIRINVAGPMRLRHGAVASSTFTAGDSGAVQIKAESLLLDQVSTIFSDSFPGSTGRAGSVQMQVSGAMTVSNNSMVSSNTLGDGDGGDVQLDINGQLALYNRGLISSATLGRGNAGAVQVKAASLSLEQGSVISSDALPDSTGQAGSVRVQVHDAMTVSDSSMVSSNAQGDGNGGDVQLDINGQLALYNRGLISSATFGKGNAGAVQVKAASLSLEQGSVISSDALPDSTGQAGSVRVQVHDAMTVSDSSMVSSNAQGDGNGGDVQLDINGQLALYNRGLISSVTLGKGNAGAVQVKAASLSLEQDSRIFSDSGSTGQAGSVRVQVHDAMTVSDNSIVSSNAQGDGDGGDVQLDINGQLALYNRGFISSATFGKGNAGAVQVQVQGTMTVANGGMVSSDTLGAGAAGDVRVAAGSLQIDGGREQFAIISSSAIGGSGDAGTVRVAVAGPLELLGGGDISSSTGTAGRAGSVVVSATEVRLDGADSFIWAKAKAGSSGQTGTVDLQASKSLTLTNGSSISILNDASVPNPERITPGALHISAPVVQLTDSQITAAASGNVDASSLNLTFGERLQLDNSQITTSSNLGNGGAISALGGQLLALKNSQITTSVLGTSGNGGDINVRSQALALNTGVIQANTAARDAAGGRVQVDVATLLPSAGALWVGGNTPYALVPGQFGLNVIQAAAPTGLSGRIDIAAPALDLSGALQGLGVPWFDSARLGHNPCDTRSGSTLAIAGRGHYPVASYGWLGLLPSPESPPHRAKAPLCLGL